jgi:hypothetical protein
MVDKPTRPSGIRAVVDNSDDAGLGEWDAGDDAAPIPPRGWLLGNQFCRTYPSSLTGPGAVGKTAMRVAQSLALTSGRELTGDHVFRRARVLFVCFEDDRDELRRRVRAAMIHHGIKAADIAGWLYLAAPRRLKLAEMQEGSPRASALVAELRRVVCEKAIDLVVLDPFIKSHSVPENDNVAIDFVSMLLAGLATELNIAVDAPHHVRKGATTAGDADNGRGASSFRDACRLVFTLTGMTPEEAQTFGIGEDERRGLVRLDSAKVNLSPPASSARWFKLVGVPLGNASTDYPRGDEVQTVEPWQPPDTWAGLSHPLLNDILTAIDKGMADGSRYSDASAARDRAAWKVVVEQAPEKTEQQARTIIKTWVKNGVLTMEEYTDPTRRETAKGLKVNATKRPS